MREEIEEVLQDFEPISLEDVGKVKLMDRVDRKYVMAVELLPVLLKQLKDQYFAQEINDNRKASYSTLYYDTPDYHFYHSHINGKLNRTKVRIRRYDDVNIQYLEAKLKSNKGRTSKVRIKSSGFKGINDEGVDFLDEYIDEIDSNNLKPVLTNSFKRMTLVNKGFNERVTIDVDLSFKKYDKTRELIAPSLCIVEIKQNRRGYSPIGLALRDMRVKKRGISKYCLGISMLFDEVKSNRYRVRVRQYEKIINNKFIINKLEK